MANSGEWISDLEDRRVEINKNNRQNSLKNDSLRDIWDNVKCSDHHSAEVPQGEGREERKRSFIKEIMAGKFLNLGKETDVQVQVQESRRIPNMRNPNRPTP